ncbi:Exodeoxyribonuclease VII small subunit [Abditibacterium utsteinense]|uniref:Exodeoxyribonuclease 7 small subunit n=1 Tax=Abditibacterium utsteinense TaxID=1960156 RepID=A0A2S8SRF8_9BACT|nr:Exodeoxyribonuclease VII small subunit [Abditibacterium utsteinense]
MGVFLLSVNKNTSESADDDLSFEEALRELEETVAALENGGVPLEKSLDLLKRGLALSDRCEQVLGEAELTIEQLMINEEGELVSQKMEEEDES